MEGVFTGAGSTVREASGKAARERLNERRAGGKGLGLGEAPLESEGVFEEDGVGERVRVEVVLPEGIEGGV